MVPEYEKNVYLEYVGQDEKKLLFYNNGTTTNRVEQLKENSAKGCALDKLVDLFSLELREILAFSEAM